MSLDRDLSDLPQALRWREWMRRIEAVLFASPEPVARASLARVVGQGVDIDLLIADLRVDLEGRPYEIARVAGNFLLRTRAAYAPAIRAAVRPDTGPRPLSTSELLVLVAIACHQPVTPRELGEMLGREISRDLIARLRGRGLIAPGPRAPQPGAPLTFVTTDQFLATFDLETLRDLWDIQEQIDASQPE